MKQAWLGLAPWYKKVKKQTNTNISFFLSPFFMCPILKGLLGEGKKVLIGQPIPKEHLVEGILGRSFLRTLNNRISSC